MTRKILILACVVLVLFVSVGKVDAISIGVKPTAINFVSELGKEAKTEILIKNTGNDPAFYKISPDAYKKNIVIAPSVLRLNSNEEKVITLTVKFFLPKNYTTDLSIVANSVNSASLAAVPGLKIPVTIKTTINAVWFIALVIILVVIFCLIISNKSV